VARSLCIWGPTGSRKTTQVKWFSRYIYERTGKSTLLYSLAGGGWSPMCDPEISAGIIIPYRGDASVTPLLAMRLISQGKWPLYPEEFNEYLTKIANKEISDENMQKSSLVPMDFSKVGGIAVEDWTSMSQVIMRYLSDKNISVGGENRNQIYKSGASATFRQWAVVDGQPVEEFFGSTILPDFNFVQNTLAGLVTNFNSLNVHTVMYTAMEGKTTEEGEKNRAPIYGPAIEGKKATAFCGGWVGDLIHAQEYNLPPLVEKVPNPSGEGEVENIIVRDTVRFYFRKHPDPANGIMCPAKPRCAPEAIKELDKIWPGGYFEPEWGAAWGIDKYLSEMERLADDAAKSDSMQAWREKADRMLGRSK
jgi:hypothetical protein